MSPTDGSEMNVMDFVKAGQYIHAIKLYREENGVGLMEAKEYVDQLRAGIEMKNLKCSSIEELKDHDASSRCSGVAMKIKSNVSRIIGNFMYSINKLPYPVKLFNDEKKAIEWLKSLEEK